MASSVCGMTPSSAATTRIATSVTSAPRARIAVNASWPGVSMNVIRRPLRSTWYALITWVIPPASPAATLVLRTRVEERCLAMVDMAEHGHDRRPGHQRPGSGVGEVDQRVLRRPSAGEVSLALLGDGVLGLRLEAEVIGGEGGGVEVDRLVERGHDAVAHQVLDQLGARHLEAIGELSDRETCRQGDLLDRGYVDSSVTSSPSAAARVGSSITSSPTRSERARDRCRRDRRRQVIPVSRQRYAPRPG